MQRFDVYKVERVPTLAKLSLTHPWSVDRSTPPLPSRPGRKARLVLSGESVTAWHALPRYGLPAYP